LNAIIHLRALQAMSLPVLLALAGCSDVSWPWSRHHDSTSIVPAGADGNNDAECAQLRADIKNNEESLRNATTESTSPEIVAASEAKAGQQIDALRQRYRLDKASPAMRRLLADLRALDKLHGGRPGDAIAALLPADSEVPAQALGVEPEGSDNAEPADATRKTN